MVLQRSDLNFIVEVANVANDRHVLHLAHMLDPDHIFVACRCDENISGRQHVFQQYNFEPVHRRLKRANRVYFGDFHTCTGTGQRSSRAFAHVAVAHDNRNFTGHHGVGCTANTVNQRFLTAIFIVEL